MSGPDTRGRIEIHWGGKWPRRKLVTIWQPYRDGQRGIPVSPSQCLVLRERVVWGNGRANRIAMDDIVVLVKAIDLAKSWESHDRDHWGHFANCIRCDERRARTEQEGGA